MDYEEGVMDYHWIRDVALRAAMEIECNERGIDLPERYRESLRELMKFLAPSAESYEKLHAQHHEEERFLIEVLRKHGGLPRDLRGVSTGQFFKSFKQEYNNLVSVLRGEGDLSCALKFCQSIYLEALFSTKRIHRYIDV